ncbi:PVC-type heme-binding CxxCH protein [Negadavirga shengliensis]|uniref:PVC-type heme-binding CxxCH protein n=1 Tax=Negadavirga shengliensis TaxID=1389218 RepID=A0ABV9T6W8_9BACT
MKEHAHRQASLHTIFLTIIMKSENLRNFFTGLKGYLLAFMLLPSVICAQNNLRDIPSPDPQIQQKMFNVADGFEVTLFAAEPMVMKPIQMNWDEQGRLWVVSSTVYPHLKPGQTPNDKIYVLEDTNGDGKADKSTVFAEGLNTPTGILPGDGGVYVANSTEILHLRDTDGDGKADQRRQILTGFGVGDTHHLIHTFRWGPDGLMYFNQSIYIYSHVETPGGIRRLEGGGVWQLQPKTLELEVYAKGLINPWGLQFDRWGQSFLTDGAGNEGINYAFPGATFMTAPGAERILRGLNPGQPKHSGLDIVSGRHMPDSWSGSLITNDFRANRINRFVLEEQGSGFVSKQVEDLLWTDHIAFRPVDITMGPDGAIYVADWYNPIIQHGEVDFHDPRRDQQHGRIWRIAAKNAERIKIPNLAGATVRELLDALKLPEDWTRLQAKQLLKNQSRDQVIPQLQQWINSLDKNDIEYEHHLLEALWVYQSLDKVEEGLLNRLLSARNPKARAAGVRVLNRWIHRLDNSAELLSNMVKDEHPGVRMEAVLALGKIRTAESARMALSVLDRPTDEFLDFALWQTVRELETYWLEQLLANPDFFGDNKKVSYALKSVSNPEAISMLVKLYQAGEVPAEYHQDVLGSISKYGKTGDLNTLLNIAMEGNGADRAGRLMALVQASRQRKVMPDSGLGRIMAFIESDDEGEALAAIRLAGLWNRTEMNMRLVSIAQDGERNRKKAALSALAMMTDTQSHQLLEEMTKPNQSPELRVLATSQLVNQDAHKAADIAINLLGDALGQEDATELFAAFLASKEGVAALTGKLSHHKIPVDMAKTGRQAMQQHLPWYRQNDTDVSQLKKELEASGGILPPERMPQQLNESQVYALVQEVKNNADPELGEAIYRKNSLMCQNCHAIGGAGGLIGPDLSSLGTSSPIDDIIRSLVNPAESIKEGYELQKITLKDGSVVMGYLVNDGASEIVVRNVGGMEETIAKSQIDTHENVPGSLMPPGLTASLDREEFINLVGYLSKLGSSGTFRVPHERYVRRWRAVSGNEALISKLRERGLAHMVDPDTKLNLLPFYSKVAGDLPLEELPIMKIGDGQQISVIRFEIEVLRQGNVQLAFNFNEGITAWSGQQQLQLGDHHATADLTQGRHEITVAIDRNVHEDGTFSIQLQETPTHSAQTRLTMGR